MITTKSKEFKFHIEPNSQKENTIRIRACVIFSCLTSLPWLSSPDFHLLPLLLIQSLHRILRANYRLETQLFPSPTHHLVYWKFSKLFIIDRCINPLLQKNIEPCPVEIYQCYQILFKIVPYPLRALLQLSSSKLLQSIIRPCHWLACRQWETSSTVYQPRTAVKYQLHFGVKGHLHFPL